MLIISKSSKCDVCLDYYGPEASKSPHIIPSCGHTFCKSCLTSLHPALCPLCRLSFDPRLPRRLVVDVDPSSITPPREETDLPDGPGSVSDTHLEQEARRLQEEFNKVVNEGSTETHLRSLIAECTSFLDSHNRSKFSQLRLTLRTIAYLTDVRLKSRSQAKSITSLTGEITSMRERLEEANRTNETLMHDHAAAQSFARLTESNLRKHLTETIDQYDLLLRSYEGLYQSWEDLRKEHIALQAVGREYLRRNAPEDTAEEAYAMSVVEKESSVSDIMSPLPDSFARLNVSLDPITPMPDTQLLSGRQASMGHGTPDTPSAQFLSPQPTSADIERPPTSERISLSPPVDLHHSVPTISSLFIRGGTSKPSSDVLIPALDAMPRSSPSIPFSPQSTPSGISLSAPRDSRSARNHDRVDSPLRTRSPMRYRDAPTRPASPSPLGIPDARPSVEIFPNRSHSFPEVLGTTSHQPSANAVSKLHDLLSSPLLSSSLPNMTNSHAHTPRTQARKDSERFRKHSPRSRPQSPSPLSLSSPALPIDEPTAVTSPSSISTSIHPRSTVSSASEAASLLEKQRQAEADRLKAERRAERKREEKRQHEAEQAARGMLLTNNEADQALSTSLPSSSPLSYYNSLGRSAGYSSTSKASSSSRNSNPPYYTASSPPTSSHMKGSLGSATHRDGSDSRKHDSRRGLHKYSSPATVGITSP